MPKCTIKSIFTGEMEAPVANNFQIRRDRLVILYSENEELFDRIRQSLSVGLLVLCSPGTQIQNVVITLTLER